MKRKPKQRKALVGVMTNPQPRFVALVKHGANQRPFHATKADKSKSKETPMSKRRTKKDGSTDVKLHRVIFSAEHFADEDAVTKHLKAEGYSDFTVLKTDDGFEVYDEEAPEGTETRLVESPSQKGVSYDLYDAPADTTDTKSDDDDEDDEDDDAQNAGTDSKADDKDNGNGLADDAKKADGKKEDDKTADTKTADTKTADTKTGDKATETTDAPRRRVRKGSTVLGGLTMSQFTAAHENFADSIAAKGTKSFGEMVENYTGGTPPGLYVMADALMGELRKSIKAGVADEDTVNKMAGDFAKGVIAMHAAYDQIITKSDKKSDEEMDEWNELLNLLFGEPTMTEQKAENVEALGTITSQLGSMDKMLKSIQGRLDTASLIATEGATGTTTVPERKSHDGHDDDDGGTEGNEAVTEAEEMDRRTRKRLGMPVS